MESLWPFSIPFFFTKAVPKTARLLLTQNWNDCFDRIAKPVRSASTSAACPSPARPSRSRTAASSVSRRWPSSPSTSPTSTTSLSSTKRVWVCRKDIRSDSRLVFRKIIYFISVIDWCDWMPDWLFSPSYSKLKELNKFRHLKASYSTQPKLFDEG